MTASSQRLRCPCCGEVFNLADALPVDEEPAPANQDTVRETLLPITLVFDGGSIGNPGRGYGSYQLTVRGKPEPPKRLEFGEQYTNNEAEYDTLLRALEAILRRAKDPRGVQLDIRAAALLGVVDRHHLVPPDLAGRTGLVQLVFLLSNVSLQSQGEQRRGLVPEPDLGERASTAPEAYGQVLAVPAWEEQRGTLAYEALYTEFLLDIGPGVVGVRTAVTADSLAEVFGKERIETG